MKQYLVGLAGPSCSGKTTLSKELIRRLPSVTLVKLDEYWQDASAFSRIYGYKNLELPSCLKLDLLHQNLSKLRQGKTTSVPICEGFEFKGFKTVSPESIILSEGFLLFYHPQIRDLFDLKVYVDIPDEVLVERRSNRRRTTKCGEDYYRRVVIPEYRKYGLPSKQHADLVLDGTLEVEVNVRSILEKILAETNIRASEA